MIKLQYGKTNTYYFDGLLIDTDLPDTLPAFYQALKQNHLTLNDIRYILATHYHPDHIGLFSQLMDHGAKLVVIDKQIDYIHFSDPIFAKQPRLRYHPICEKDAIVIRCEESRDFLRRIGISGEIIPTESHSPDGIALIDDHGSCFVGDLEPMQYLEAHGWDSPLGRDWKAILAHHPVNAYFGHMNDQKF